MCPFVLNTQANIHLHMHTRLCRQVACCVTYNRKFSIKMINALCRYIHTYSCSANSLAYVLRLTQFSIWSSRCSSDTRLLPHSFHAFALALATSRSLALCLLINNLWVENWWASIKHFCITHNQINCVIIFPCFIFFCIFGLPMVWCCCVWNVYNWPRMWVCVCAA